MIFTAETITQQLNISPNQQKMFIFDLDGTIIYDGLRMEERFELVLKDIVAAGHFVYFATGRSYRDFIPMVPEWCTNLPSVVFGGAMVINSGEVLHQKFLPADKLSTLMKILEDNNVVYLLDGQTEYYHSTDDSWILKDIMRISGQKPIHNPDNILSDGAYKILILDTHWKDYCHDIAIKNNWELKYHSYNNCFDLMPSGVNKYAGLQYLPLISKENTFVFGNDHNDLELMQNFSNNIMFGDYHELVKYAKVKIEYDDDLFENFAQVVNCILKR